MCKNEAINFHISRIGSYWNSQTEIDVVAIDEQSKRIIAGECKFWTNPLDISVYSELVKKCETIPEFKGYDISYALFSKSGFDEKLLNLARTNKKLILINENKVLE